MSTDDRPKMSELHVYGQSQGHDDTFLVGTREAMERLLDALTRALAGGAAHEEFMAHDGEGYDMHIAVSDEAELEALQLPYSDGLPGLDVNPGQNPYVLFRFLDKDSKRLPVPERLRIAPLKEKP